MNAARLELQHVADRNLDAVTAMDAATVVAGFSENGVLIDPHYPDAEMRGPEAITAGLRFAFDSMKTFAFDDRRYFHADDDTSLVIHCTCHHVLTGGRALDFPQVFLMDTRDGRITRWQAFEPYGPDGVGGFLLGVGKTAFKVRRAFRNRTAGRDRLEHR